MDSRQGNGARELDFKLVQESAPVGSQFQMFDDLRSKYPSFHTDDLNGFWVLTEHEGISNALHDWETFSSESIYVGDPNPARNWPPVMVDPPEHTYWRRQLSPLFSPRAVERYRGLITDRCNELISRFADRGSCDFVADFSRMYPTYVFLSVMGIPVEDLDQLMSWQADIERPPGQPDAPEMEQRTLHAAFSLALYLAEVVKEKKANPQDDVISQALTWELDGKPITEKQVAEMTMMLSIPGLATVVGQMGYTWWHLATHEDIRRQVASSPEIIPGALEEFLRLYAPGVVARKLAKDSRVGGCPMKAGEMVMLPTGSANRDPKVFPDPDRFVLDRPGANRHLTFGAGAHYCLGANLARLEIQIALEQWHKFIPEYRLAPDAEVEEYRSQAFWVKSIPLVWP
jgi:cytochrome P450